MPVGVTFWAPVYLTTIKNVNSVVYNFLWNGKPDKIKRLALISDYKDGGLKLPHIESLIKTQ